MQNRKNGLDEFLDALIEEAIESNGCYCGGGKENKLDVVVELGRRSDDPDAKLKRITKSLDARRDVQNWLVGEEFGGWHGDYKAIDYEIEQKESV